MMTPDNLRAEQQKWEDLYASLQLEEEDPAISEFNQEFVAKVSALLPDGGSILEAGCGAGWQSLALARNGRFKVNLMDFASNALEYSQRLFAREGQTACWIEGDLAQPGLPEYDLVFNSGVLEHYPLDIQAEFIRNMASRSRKYVVVMVPNQMCYWYWLWRIQKTKDRDWVFGQEVPQADLSHAFKAAGVRLVGQAYLAKSWTESFIHHLNGIDEDTRKEIQKIHRTGMIPEAQSCYLLAALGSVEKEQGSLPGWGELSHAQARPSADLSAALAEALAANLQQTADFNRMNAEKDQQMAQEKAKAAQAIEEKNQQVIAAQAELERSNYQLSEIYSSTAWKMTRLLWKIKLFMRDSRSWRGFINRLRTLKYKIKSIKTSRLAAAPRAAQPENVSSIQQHLNSSGNAEDRVWIVAHQFLDHDGNNLFLGGAERYLLELARVIRNTGYDPQVLQIGKGNWIRYVDQLKVVGINVNGDQNIFNQLIPMVDLKCRLVIYSPFSIAQKPLKVPTIGISHGIFWDHPGYQAPLSATITKLTRSLSAVDRIVSVDTATINWIRSTVYKEAEKAVYIPNFVDTAEFQPGAHAGNSRLVVLFPRRLFEARGYYLVIHILPELVKKYPQLEFHFVGRGSPDVESHLSDLMLEYPGQVKWYHLPFERMHEAYRTADITLIPTLSGEGTSLSCLEALASGNAVIATHVGGLSDLILHGQNGLLIEPNEQALKNAIVRLVEDDMLRQHLGQNGRKVAESFNAEIWRSRWRKVLQNVCQDFNANL